ncbi:uncharacterized protein LOC132797950 [Drosophila nasuta]|uniref:uncharacterized protein LOC132797950 n=1 Tax=Drosophila nasuta TaxID=42062 RepID=UPI00295F42FE|nr:uncharacterized protein LOC132797950 [Drosophila nasuta]
MLKSRVLHGEESVVQSNNVEPNIDSLNRESEELDFPLEEEIESVDSGLNLQLNENSTNLENADPVVTGDKLKEIENDEEIRRSERLRVNFDEINFRDDRSLWEEAIKDELNSHFENNTWSLVQKPNNKNIVDSPAIVSASAVPMLLISQPQLPVVFLGQQHLPLAELLDSELQPVAELVELESAALGASWTYYQ